MKRIIQNSFLIIISIIIGVLLIEASLWIFNLPPYPETVFSGNAPDRENGFVLRPNSTTRHSSWEFDTIIHVNSIGIRGSDKITENTSPFSFILGDSFAQGHGVEEDETMAAKLELLLQSGPVVNLGVDSYSTYQVVTLFKRYADFFKEKPKYAVLVFYVGNDYYDNRRFREYLSQSGRTLQTVSNGILVEDGTEVKFDGDYLVWYRAGKEMSRKRNPGFYPPDGYENKWLDWSKLYNAWAWLDAPKKKTCQIPIAIPGLFDRTFKFETSKEWDATKEALDDFVTTATNEEVSPFLVIMPSKYQLFPDLLVKAGCDVSKLDTETSVRILEEYAHKSSLKTVNLLQKFRGLSEREKARLYFKVDSHLTPYGNSVAGKFIAEKIR